MDEEHESREERLERRLDQIDRGVRRAIDLEVEWLKRHGFPVWVWEDGRIVDASKAKPAHEAQEVREDEPDRP